MILLMMNNIEDELNLQIINIKNDIKEFEEMISKKDNLLNVQEKIILTFNKIKDSRDKVLQLIKKIEDEKLISVEDKLKLLKELNIGQ